MKALIRQVWCLGQKEDRSGAWYMGTSLVVGPVRASGSLIHCDGPETGAYKDTLGLGLCERTSILDPQGPTR